MMQRGRESVVRFINHGDRENSVHLHGSYSRAPFDGWAEDTLLIGQYKDYCKSAKCLYSAPWPLFALADICWFSYKTTRTLRMEGRYGIMITALG